MLPAGEESEAVPKSSAKPVSVNSWKLGNVYRDRMRWGEREQHRAEHKNI